MDSMSLIFIGVIVFVMSGSFGASLYFSGRNKKGLFCVSFNSQPPYMNVIRKLDENKTYYTAADWAPGPGFGELWILEKDKARVQKLIEETNLLEITPTAFIVRDENQQDPNFKGRY